MKLYIVFLIDFELLFRQPRRCREKTKNIVGKTSAPLREKKHFIFILFLIAVAGKLGYWRFPVSTA